MVHALKTIISRIISIYYISTFQTVQTTLNQSVIRLIENIITKFITKKDLQTQYRIIK